MKFLQMGSPLAVRIILIFSFLVNWGAEARQTKVQKRHYTFKLRRWIQLLEFTFDDNILQQPLQQVRRKELVRLTDTISSQLTKKKKRRFLEQFDGYWESFQRGAKDKRKFLELRKTAFSLYRVVTAPSQIPDFSLGKNLYQKQCATCHGEKGRGNGPFTQNTSFPMNPMPKDLTIQYEEGTRSPYSYFNSIVIGSPGTAMNSYDKSLTSHEIWSLSFYISAGWKKGSYPRKSFNLSLEELSVLTNDEIARKYPDSGSIRHAREFLPFEASTARK